MLLHIYLESKMAHLHIYVSFLCHRVLVYFVIIILYYELMHSTKYLISYTLLSFVLLNVL